jgi:catechol 2,3-dioxygenase-like lactoylglutathione lyase family enzyme
MSLPVHHFGRTVSNLERSVEFYKLFGGEEVAAEHFCGPQFAKVLGFDDSDFEMRLVKVGDMHIELLRYLVPAGEPAYTARNCDVGAAHICFVVDDIAEAYQRFTSLGVPSYSAPEFIHEGDFAGAAFVYLLDPDGLPVELIQLPGEAA